MKTAWNKVAPELAAAFDDALPADPAVQRRQMFGCPCAFVGGHMFAGTHEHRLVVRVPDEAPKRPFVVMGRTMREYAAFDDPLALSAAERRRWIQRAFDFTRALPPKLATPAARRAARPTVKANVQSAAQPAKPAAKSGLSPAAGRRKARPAAKT